MSPSGTVTVKLAPFRCGVADLGSPWAAIRGEKAGKGNGNVPRAPVLRAWQGFNRGVVHPVPRGKGFSQVSPEYLNAELNLGWVVPAFERDEGYESDDSEHLVGDDDSATKGADESVLQDDLKSEGVAPETFAREAEENNAEERNFFEALLDDETEDVGEEANFFQALLANKDLDEPNPEQNFFEALLADDDEEDFGVEANFTEASLAGIDVEGPAEEQNFFAALLAGEDDEEVGGDASFFNVASTSVHEAKENSVADADFAAEMLASEEGLAALPARLALAKVSWGKAKVPKVELDEGASSSSAMELPVVTDATVADEDGELKTGSSPVIVDAIQLATESVVVPNEDFGTRAFAHLEQESASASLVRVAEASHEAEAAVVVANDDIKAINLDDIFGDDDEDFEEVPFVKPVPKVEPEIKRKPEIEPVQQHKPLCQPKPVSFYLSSKVIMYRRGFYNASKVSKDLGVIREETEEQLAALQDFNPDGLSVASNDCLLNDGWDQCF